MNPNLVLAIFEGWHDYQKVIMEAIKSLDAKQLELRATPKLRSIVQIAAHIIGARARWFYLLMGEGGEEFIKLGRWHRRG